MFYFEANRMESQDNKGLLRHLKIVDGDGNAVSEVKPGSLVTITGLATNDIYGTIKNLSTYTATAPAALTDVIVIVDPDEVPATKVDGNIYKFIPLNYGISADGNKPLRGRVVKVDDIFTFSDENFVSAPTVGQFATATAGKHTYTPAADLSVALPTGGFAVKIEEAYNATTGAEMGFLKYVCRVVQI